MLCYFSEGISEKHQGQFPFQPQFGFPNPYNPYQLPFTQPPVVRLTGGDPGSYTDLISWMTACCQANALIPLTHHITSPTRLIIAVTTSRLLRITCLHHELPALVAHLHHTLLPPENVEKLFSMGGNVLPEIRDAICLCVARQWCTGSLPEPERWVWAGKMNKKVDDGVAAVLKRARDEGGWGWGDVVNGWSRWVGKGDPFYAGMPGVGGAYGYGMPYQAGYMPGPQYGFQQAYPGPAYHGYPPQFPPMPNAYPQYGAQAQAPMIWRSPPPAPLPEQSTPAQQAQTGPPPVPTPPPPPTERTGRPRSRASYRDRRPRSHTRSRHRHHRRRSSSTSTESLLRHQTPRPQAATPLHSATPQPQVLPGAHAYRNPEWYPHPSHPGPRPPIFGQSPRVRMPYQRYAGYGCGGGPAHNPDSSFEAPQPGEVLRERRQIGPDHFVFYFVRPDGSERIVGKRDGMRMEGW